MVEVAVMANSMLFGAYKAGPTSRGGATDSVNTGRYVNYTYVQQNTKHLQYSGTPTTCTPEIWTFSSTGPRRSALFTWTSQAQ